MQHLGNGIVFLVITQYVYYLLALTMTIVAVEKDFVQSLRATGYTNNQTA